MKIELYLKRSFIGRLELNLIYETYIHNYYYECLNIQNRHNLFNISLVQSKIKSISRKLQKHNHTQGSTSLPPRVDGQLRRYVKVDLLHLQWIDPGRQDVSVRLLWWGEVGEGTLFRSSN